MLTIIYTTAKRDRIDYTYAQEKPTRYNHEGATNDDEDIADGCNSPGGQSGLRTGTGTG